MIGGELKAVTEAIVGAEAVEGLKKYHFTKGFFGTNGADAVSGYTTPDITEALVKERQCSNAGSAMYWQMHPRSARYHR